MTGKLGKMHWKEPEAQHVHRVDPARDTKTQLQVILGGFLFPVMVNDLAHVFQGPLRMPPEALHGILYRTRDLSLLFLQENELVLHDRLFIGQSQYIREL